jgi:hypothetical protein
MVYGGKKEGWQGKEEGWQEEEVAPICSVRRSVGT